MPILILIIISMAVGYVLGIFIHSGYPHRAISTMLLIDALREHEGATVEIACDNPEPETRQDQACITVIDDWTNWEPRRFDGETVLECLQKAKLQKELSETIETVMKEQGKEPARLWNCSLDVCPSLEQCKQSECAHPRSIVSRY